MRWSSMTPLEVRSLSILAMRVLHFPCLYMFSIEKNGITKWLQFIHFLTTIQFTLSHTNTSKLYLHLLLLFLIKDYLSLVC